MQGACYRRFVSGTGLAGGDRQGPYRLVVRTSRCGRDNPGSAPGEDIVSYSPLHKRTRRFIKIFIYKI